MRADVVAFRIWPLYVHILCVAVHKKNNRCLIFISCIKYVVACECLLLKASKTKSTF